MHMLDYLKYSNEALPNNQMVQLPFVGSEDSGGLSMTIVLPLDLPPSRRSM